MRILCFILTILSLSTSVIGCGKELPGKRPTAEGFEREAEAAKLLGLERQKFDAAHDLKGKIANVAWEKLSNEGYTCGIIYLDLAYIPEGKLLMQFRKTPLVACEQPSSVPNDICVQRRVTLSIAWKDPKAEEAQLHAQLATSLITDRTFTCEPRL